MKVKLAEDVAEKKKKEGRETNGVLLGKLLHLEMMDPLAKVLVTSTLVPDLTLSEWEKKPHDSVGLVARKIVKKFPEGDNADIAASIAEVAAWRRYKGEFLRQYLGRGKGTLGESQLRGI